jgi:sugar phosphate isomerase/epimerase
MPPAAGFSALCEAAAATGLVVALEPFPFGPIPTPAAAARLIRAVEAPNARILLDSWQFHRAGAPWDELASLPAGSVACLQLSDARAVPAADLAHETMHGRLLPGQGVIDFDRLFETLRGSGQTPDLAVEVISDELAALDPYEAAARVAAATRAVLSRR